MNVKFGYGKGEEIVEIPDRNLIGILTPNHVKHAHRGIEAVRYAMLHPIGTPVLRDIVKPGQKIAIIVSDITRPVPSYEIVPLVIEELIHKGCSVEDITIIFGLGSHRHHTHEEQKRLVGEYIFERVRCIDSDSDDYVHMGTTERGTPVDITRAVSEADIRICIGNIEFHYFAGYSGGAKALMPGVSTYAAIQANHKMMLSEDACVGNLDGNPIRMDIEEAGRIVGIDYIINVVLDEHKKIVYAVAGHPVYAHRVGCLYLDKMYISEIHEWADIVIVSAGGAPKDVNLYQMQKAIENAKYAVKMGGRIILIGACNEGFGNKIFEKWLISATTPHSIINRIKEEFVLGGHKAAAVARILENVSIDLVSSMEDAFVKSIFMSPKSSAQEALNDAISFYGKNATVIAMPFGGSTLPRLKV